MRPFPDRLVSAIRTKASCVVVGLDPRLALLPKSLRLAAFRRFGRGRRGAAEAIRAFNREVLQVVAPRAVAVKPQVAFYEAFGPEGMAAFADSLSDARAAGLLTIADVKRGDVPSTAEAYADAYFPAATAAAAAERRSGRGRQRGRAAASSPTGAPFDADAVTLQPYLGEDSVRPFLRGCAEAGRGVFFLVRTSNPGAAEFQDLRCGGRPFYRVVARAVDRWGGALVGECGYSAVGAVVGATAPAAAAALRRDLPRAFFLVPGYGAQGGGAGEVRPCFDRDGLGALIAASRSITFAYTTSPGKEAYGERRWERAVEEALLRMNQELAAVRNPVPERARGGS
ncbi:MAG: orotidine-5'-phosphate decarboxylase [Planctomycetes bacterium]|nr:orotidine-5'-phosphate decarboxylase [Planctomycetota bacterium]